MRAKVRVVRSRDRLGIRVARPQDYQAVLFANLNVISGPRRQRLGKVTADHDWLRLEARSSVLDGLRNECVEFNLVGIDGFMTAADVVDSFQKTG